jgi:hypothetical protein
MHSERAWCWSGRRVFNGDLARSIRLRERTLSLTATGALQKSERARIGDEQFYCARQSEPAHWLKE